MLRRLLIGTALAGVLAGGAPAIAFAQPPSPPEVVRKIDRGVRHAVTNTHHAVRRATHRTRRTVRYHTASTVRAMCNDGRIHTGRTRTSACWTHGGYRG